MDVLLKETTMIDFQQVKRDVSIERAVSLVGLTLKPEGNQLRGACPACKKGGERALVVTPEKGVFYCFADQKGGDVISLVAHIHQCSLKEAGSFLAKSRETVPEKKKGEEQSTLQPLTYLDPGHDEVIARGFTEDIATKVGIGYASKGMMRGLVCFPVRLPDGTLIGYAGIIGGVKTPKNWRIP